MATYLEQILQQLTARRNAVAAGQPATNLTPQQQQAQQLAQQTALQQLAQQLSAQQGGGDQTMSRMPVGPDNGQPHTVDPNTPIKLGPNGTFDSSGPDMPATVPSGPTSPAAPAQNPTAELANAYQMYLHKRGLTRDPLLSRGGQVVKQGAGADSALGAIAQVAFRNQRAGNPRAGMIGQAIKVGGTTFHVYYDPKTGKRQVLRVSGNAIGPRSRNGGFASIA